MKKAFLVTRGNSNRRQGSNKSVVICTQEELEQIRKLDVEAVSRQIHMQKCKDDINNLINNIPQDWTTDTAQNWAYQIREATDELAKVSNPRHHEYIHPSIDIEDVIIFESLGEYLL